MSEKKITPKIILASTSKIRAKILLDAKIKFDAIPPLFDEEKAKKNLKSLSIKNMALFLASQKALSISKIKPDCYVIGSDQICELNEEAISKPKNKSGAILQLLRLTGNTHFQNNATVVAFNGKIIFKNFSRVKLEMRKLSKTEITHYVEIDNPVGCAGSYKYESLGKHLFAKITGDYYSVLGLSIQPLINFFHSKNIISLWKFS